MSKIPPIKTRQVKEIFRSGKIVDNYIKDEVGRQFERGEASGFNTELGRDSVQGGCLDFDGATSYVRIPHTNIHPLATNLTFEVDAIFDDNTTGAQSGRCIASCGTWGGGDAVYIGIEDSGNINSNTNLIVAFFNVSWRVFDCGFVPVVGVRYNIKALIDTTKTRVFVNDVYIGTLNYIPPSNINTCEWLIGDRHDVAHSSKFDGKIWDLKVFNVLKIQENLKSGDTSNIAGWWRLNESAGNLVYDASGNNHTGNITTASWSNQNHISYADKHGYGKGLQLLADGDMEKVGVTDWTAVNNALLTKQTSAVGVGTQCLRVAFNGTTYPYAHQSILTVGQTYRIRGYVRGDGTANAIVYMGASTRTFTSTSSTAWQYFDVTQVANSHSQLRLTLEGGSAGQYVEFDNIKVEAVDVKYPVAPVSPSGTLNVPDEYPNLVYNGDASIDDTSMFFKSTSAGMFRVKENNTSDNYVWRIYRSTDTESGYPYVYFPIANGKRVKVKFKMRTDGTGIGGIHVYRDSGSELLYVSSTYRDSKWYHFEEDFTTGSSGYAVLFRVVSNADGNNKYIEIKDVEILDLDQELAISYTPVVTSPDGVLDYTTWFGGRVNYNMMIINNNCIDLGSTSYLGLTAPINFAYNKNHMVEYYFTFNTGGGMTLMGSSAETSNYLYYHPSTNTQIQFYDGGGVAVATFSSAFQAGHTYRIVGDYNASTGNVTITRYNLTDGSDNETEVLSLAGLGATWSIDIDVIGNRGLADRGFVDNLFGITINTDNINRLVLPCAEGAGNIAHDVSGNGNHATWTGTPAFSTQDYYAYNTKYGYTLSGTTYIPALLDGSNGADGNPIGQLGGIGYNQSEASIKFADDVAELIQADINDEIFFSSGTAQELDATVFDAELIEGKHGYFIKDHANRNILSVFDKDLQYNKGIYSAQGSGGTNAKIDCGDVLDAGFDDIELSCMIIMPTGYTVPAAYAVNLCGKSYIGNDPGRYNFVMIENILYFIIQASASVADTVSVPFTSIPKDVPVKLRGTADRSGYMRMYINDIEVGTPVDISSRSTYDMQTTSTFQILGTNLGIYTKQSFTGKLWDVKVWIGGVLKGYWPLNNSTYDVSGNGNHGTWSVDIPKYTMLTHSEMKTIDYDDILQQEGFSIGSNIVLNSNDLTQSSWTKRGTAVATYNQADPFGGTSATKIAGFAPNGSGDVYQIVASTDKGKHEPQLWIKPVTLTGNITVGNPNNLSYGSWTIDYTKLISGEWNYITKAHPAVTVTYEFARHTSGTGLIMFAATTGNEVHFYGCQLKEYFIPANQAIPTQDVLGNTLTNPAKNGLLNNAPATFDENKYEIVRQLTYTEGE